MDIFRLRRYGQRQPADPKLVLHPVMALGPMTSGAAVFRERERDSNASFSRERLIMSLETRCDSNHESLLCNC
jgi:hypothetical protein